MRVGTLLVFFTLRIHKVVSFATLDSFTIRHHAPSLSQSKLWNSRDDSVSPLDTITKNPTRSILFSVSQTTAGAMLGPFLDSYHSANGVLQYDSPFFAQLWGSTSIPALTTTWWVPPLFGLAGFLIGWLYVIFDNVFEEENMTVTPPIILVGISLFTFQYWLSGILYVNGVDRYIIFWIMSIFAFFGYSQLDGTKSGLVTSVATALGGPLIEIGLITTLQGTNGGYHYNDLGETGFFPLWIIPVYFLGGPANGNLARGVWKALGKLYSDNQNSVNKSGCSDCKDSRVVPCPNCDGVGYYTTFGREVKCNCCKGRGLVMCRNCFDWYGEDPSDIEAIREFMSRIPD
jgi:DnaJ-class molecular chaperone with C-terminal Zn finger domain